MCYILLSTQNAERKLFPGSSLHGGGRVTGGVKGERGKREKKKENPLLPPSPLSPSPFLGTQLIILAMWTPPPHPNSWNKKRNPRKILFLPIQKSGGRGGGGGGEAAKTDKRSFKTREPSLVPLRKSRREPQNWWEVSAPDPLSPSPTTPKSAFWAAHRLVPIGRMRRREKKENEI